ncbi:MAG: neutral zinc metallopeptidase [Solirubrobacteraceae bacterium]|nr:neutral zinc metallopeptidase [Solirubrobacteraceae bacterium]
MTRRSPLTLLATVAAAATLAITGCSDSGTTTTTPADAPSSGDVPASTTTAGQPFKRELGPTLCAIAPGVCGAERVKAPPSVLADPQQREQREKKVLEDAGYVARLLNEYWTAELQRTWGVTFDVPGTFEAYRGPTSGMTCGGPIPPEQTASNAFYCSADDEERVAFDLDWFQGYLADYPGGATTFLILAHEWGHAVQDTWDEQGIDPGANDYRDEIQADCLAGVFLHASLRSGALIEEPDDAPAVLSWLYSAGSSQWLDPRSHGTRQQRQAAFILGYNGTAKACQEGF